MGIKEMTDEEKDQKKELGVSLDTPHLV